MFPFEHDYRFTQIRLPDCPCLPDNFEFLPCSTPGTGVLSAVRNTVSQLEREADALMDIISPSFQRNRSQNRTAGGASRNNQGATSSSSSANQEAGSSSPSETEPGQFLLNEDCVILTSFLKTTNFLNPPLNKN